MPFLNKTVLLVVTLGAILVLAIAAALQVWLSLADVSLSTHGMVALVGGAIGTFVLGAGLMALSFYSARHGYDDGVENWRPKRWTDRHFNELPADGEGD